MKSAVSVERGGAKNDIWPTAGQQWSGLGFESDPGVSVAVVIPLDRHDQHVTTIRAKVSCRPISLLSDCDVDIRRRQRRPWYVHERTFVGEMSSERTAIDTSLGTWMVIWDVKAPGAKRPVPTRTPRLMPSRAAVKSCRTQVAARLSFTAVTARFGTPTRFRLATTPILLVTPSSPYAVRTAKLPPRRA